MPRARTCVDCDDLIGPGETRCSACKRERNRERDAHRPSRRKVYDQRHRNTRDELLPLAIGTPCPRCGELMLEHQALDLGHSVPVHLDPLSEADRIEHASCNRAAGAVS